MDTDSPNALSRRCPYVGLTPFSEKDAEFFFGRTADIEIVATNLRAAPLTVFYGSSGVGKSSLLNAGVVPYLRRMSTASTPPDEPPEYILVTLRDWANDPIQGLKTRIAEAVYDAVNNKLLPKRAAEDLTDAEPVELLSPGDVTATSEGLKPVTDLFTILKSWTDFTGTSLIIILDQFEDFFMHRKFALGPGSFGEEFPKVVNNKDLPVHFMLSLRDDALAKLDFFKGRIPELTRNTLRLDHLNREAAKEAITRPVEKYDELANESFTIEDSLVERLLEDLQVDQIKFETEGQANVDQLQLPQTGSTVSDRDYRVETPYLQLVMVRLWEHDDTQATKCLAYDTLTNAKKLGGVEEVVRTYLDKVLDGFSSSDKELLTQFIHFTVTKTGTKIPSSAAGLAEWAEKRGSRDDIERILTTLSTGQNRIFRTVENLKDPENRYYIVSHDALAPAILSWRTRYLDQVNSSKLLRVKKWAQLVLPTLFLIIIGGVIAIAYLSYTSKIAWDEVENTNKALTEVQSETNQLRSTVNQQSVERDNVAEMWTILNRLKDDRSSDKKKNDLEKLRSLNASSSLTETEVSALIDTAIKTLDENTAREVKKILGTTVKIHITGREQEQGANDLKAKLEAGEFAVMPLAMRKTPAFLGNTEIKYFRESDKTRAERLRDFIVKNKSIQNIREISLQKLYSLADSPDAPPGLVELFFADYAFPVNARIAKTTDGIVSLRRTAEVRGGDNSNEITRLKTGEKVVRQYCQPGAPAMMNGSSGRWCWIQYTDRSRKRSEGWVFDAFLDYSVASDRKRPVSARVLR